MSTTLVVNSSSFEFPTTGDENWGPVVTNWAKAITNGALQKSGGAFTLTAEVDFGATYGIKVATLKSRAINLASTGIIRLGSGQSISWRNAANSADLELKTNSSTNSLTYNSIDLVDTSSAQTLKGKTLSSVTLVNSIISGVTLSTVNGLYVDGNTVLGNSSSDTITFTGRANSNFLPTTSGRALGGTSNRWNLFGLNISTSGTLHVGGSSTFNGVINLPSGSASAPALTFTGDTNLGIYRSAADNLSFATSGVLRANINSTGAFSIVNSLSIGTTLTVNGNTVLGNSSSDTITFTGRAASDFIPVLDSTYDLGTSLLHWAEAHIDVGYIDIITASAGSIANNFTIGTSTSNTLTVNSTPTFIGNLSVLRTDTSNPVFIEVNNNSLSSGDAYILIDVDGTGTPSLGFETPDSNFTLGIHIDDNFQICRASTLNSNIALRISTSGTLVFDTSSSTRLHTMYGRFRVIDNAKEVIRFDEISNLLTMQLGPGISSGGEFWSYMPRTDCVYKIVAGTTDTSDSGIWLYGDTHASLPGKFAIKGTAGAENFGITGTGVVTLGASGSTQTHNVNGSLTLTGATNQNISLNLTAAGTGRPSLTLTAPSGASGSTFLDIISGTTPDAYLRFRQGTGGQIWSIGLDNSDSDAFKISDDSGVGSNDYFVISTGGGLTLGLSSLSAIHTFNGPIRYPLNVNTFSGSSGSFANNYRYRKLTASSAKSMLGIEAGVEGQVITYVNSGGDLTVVNESGSATAANRIITGSGADIVITGDGAVTLIYDNVSARWRVINFVN